MTTRDVAGAVFTAGLLLSFPALAVAVTLGVLFWRTAMNLVRNA